MTLSSSWTSLLWTGTSLLLAVMMLAIALRYLRQRERGHLLIVIGGILAGILGISSQIIRTVIVHNLFSSFDSDRFRTVWPLTNLGFVFGQLIFLAGILLAASRASNERQRIAELEAIIRDRDGDNTP